MKLRKVIISFSEAKVEALGNIQMADLRAMFKKKGSYSPNRKDERVKIGI